MMRATPGHGLLLSGLLSVAQAGDPDRGVLSTLDELVVTDTPYRMSYRLQETEGATRTFTPIEEIPQSISVITRRLIDDQQVNTIAEALRNVSGVVINNDRLTPAFDNTRIRGFSAEQTIDGFTQYYNPGDRDSTVNIAHIEVLKGTNGLLYGGGSGSPVGGLIHIVTKRPQRDPALVVGGKLGPDNYQQIYVDLNRPLTDNALFRVTGEYTRSNSEIDVLDMQRYNINPTLLFTLNSRTDLTLNLRSSRWRQQDYQGLPATGTVRGDVALDPYQFLGPSDIPDSHSGFDSLGLRLDHYLDETWTLNLQTRFARSEFEEKVQTIVGSGFDFGADRPLIEPPALAVALGRGQLPYGLFDGHLYQEQNERSLVANAVGVHHRGRLEHTVLLGLDYSRYDDDGFINAGAPGGGVIPIIDLADPVFFPFVEPGPGRIDNLVRNTVYGFYGQLQTSIDDRWHLLFGARYGVVEIDYQSPGNRQITRRRRWIPRVGAVYDLTDSLSVFGGYSEGMRGQPFALFVTAPEPEYSSQREIGLKFNLAARLSGQLAYFEIERENVSVPTPDPQGDGGFGSVPEGEQFSRGYEFEAVWQPGFLAGFSVLGSYSRLSTGFRDDLFAFASSSDELPGVPRNSGRLWFNYDFQDMGPNQLRVGAGVYAQDATRISLRNPFLVDAYYTVDMSAGYETPHWGLGLAVKNLTDRFYYERLNYFGGRTAPARERAVYLSGEYRF